MKKCIFFNFVAVFLINLMWYGTLRCCDVLFIKINNKTKCNYISSFFPNFFTYRGSTVVLRVYYES